MLTFTIYDHMYIVTIQSNNFSIANLSGSLIYDQTYRMLNNILWFQAGKTQHSCMSDARSRAVISTERCCSGNMGACIIRSSGALAFQDAQRLTEEQGLP